MAAVMERGDKVTREQLEAYRSMQEEIKELRYKMEHIADNNALVGNDVINDYRSGFPVPQPVIGTDHARYWRMRNRYESRIAQLERECEEVEEYIENIQDSITRRIFRMYYIDGMSQSKIAKTVHMAQSVVSEKITNFINSDKNDKKV